MPGLESGGSSQQPLFLLLHAPAPSASVRRQQEEFAEGPGAWVRGEEGKREASGETPEARTPPKSPSQAEGLDFSFISEVQGSWSRRSPQTPRSFPHLTQVCSPERHSSVHKT